MRYWEYNRDAERFELWETREGFSSWSLHLAGFIDRQDAENRTETELHRLAIERFGVPFDGEFAASESTH